MSVHLQSDSMYFSYLWSCPNFFGTTTFTYKYSRSCLYSALSLSLLAFLLNYIFFAFFFSLSLLRDLTHIILTLSEIRSCCVESAPFPFLLGLFATDRAQSPLSFISTTFISLTSPPLRSFTTLQPK